jgi:predicted GNAT family N-acyltransferase
MKGFQYQFISFSSLFYQGLIDLRQKVLRTPLGLRLEFDQTQTDPKDWHLGALDQAHLIGVVSLSPLADEYIQMRQMAIEPLYQSKGIGRELVRKAEHTILQRGYKYVQLDARESAINFYKKAGYHTSSGSFMKTGIPHYRMAKTLTSEAIGSE